MVLITEPEHEPFEGPVRPKFAVKGEKARAGKFTHENYKLKQHKCMKFSLQNPAKKRVFCIQHKSNLLN